MLGKRSTVKKQRSPKTQTHFGVSNNSLLLVDWKFTDGDDFLCRHVTLLNYKQWAAVSFLKLRGTNVHIEAHEQNKSTSETAAILAETHLSCWKKNTFGYDRMNKSGFFSVRLHSHEKYASLVEDRRLWWFKLETTKRWPCQQVVLGPTRSGDVDRHVGVEHCFRWPAALKLSVMTRPSATLAKSRSLHCNVPLV